MSTPTKEQIGYLSTLEDVATVIQKAQVNLKKCPKQRLTEGYVTTVRKTVERYWEDFREAHNQLTKCTPREQKGALPYFQNEEYYKIEDLYLCLHADLSDILSQFESPQKNVEIMNMTSSSQEGSLSFSKLPRIELPTFSGKYEDWPSYQDLFTALVHNTSLNNVQKLHYLKTSVAGEAEMLLRHIQITENNYTQAWELLQGRFGNTKMIVNSILRRMFGQKKAANHSANQIKSLLDITTECINSLKNMKISTDSWDPIIVFMIGQKLDTELLIDWEEHALKEKKNDMPSWEDMQKFLESKFRTLELVAPIASTSREKPQAQKSFHVTIENGEEESEDIFQAAHANVYTEPTCTFCNGNHYIFNCKEFAKQTVPQRQEFAQNNLLCYNCLVPIHIVLRCKQNTTHRLCKKKHHSLLHQDKEVQPQMQSQIQPEQKITTAHFSREQTGHDVLLATAQVEVKASNGDTHILRALIDQGSEASFVSARVVDLLELKRSNINGVVSGVGEGSQTPLKHLVDLSIMSRYTNQPVQVKAYVLKTISTRLPSRHITMNWPKELQTLELADPTYHTPSKIDLLLGAAVFCKIIEDGLVRMADGIVAQKTSLGWILSGQMEDKPTINSHNVVTLHLTRMVAEDKDMLRRFWELEAILSTKRRNSQKRKKHTKKYTKIQHEETKQEDTRYIYH